MHFSTSLYLAVSLLVLHCSAQCNPTGNTMLGPCINWCYDSYTSPNGQRTPSDWLVNQCLKENCLTCKS
ncbi:unnamed protein product [Cercospora beticola]|nr:unnamed protein product [Cercospora beticola]